MPSLSIVGYQVYEEESSQNAADMLKDTCLRENIKPNQVTLHSDNGAPMKGATMLAALAALGVSGSFSRPSVSNDNPYIEALFKTVKFCPFYPEQPFESLLAARQWTEEFEKWYNGTHLHSGIKFVTPNQRHKGEDRAILAKRKKVYEEAKKSTLKDGLATRETGIT